MATLRSAVFFFLLLVVWTRGFGSRLVDDGDPDTLDLSPFVRVNASSTCGESGPEKFCYLTDAGFEKGHHCDMCDGPDAHSIAKVIDGTTDWWKSPNGRHDVTVTIDLRVRFYVSYLLLTMGPSPKPAAWVLERSNDFGRTYRTWQFFAEQPEACKRRFGVPADLPLRVPDQVLCRADPFHHLKYEEVIVMLVKGRPGADRFVTNRALQAWASATHIRLRFLQLQTLGGEKIHDDLSTRQRHFYSLQSVVVGGRCACHGHEVDCILRADEVRCVCSGHTCGPTCSECCPGFRQYPWTEGVPCRPCNCHGHADDCEYVASVAERRLSVDVDESIGGGGGGVCVDCRHHTSGVNCAECRAGFFADPAKLINDSRRCRACDCDSFGSVGTDCDGRDGRCTCRSSVAGRRCDRCVLHHWRFPECNACNCFSSGAETPHCDAQSGQCRCRLNFVGPRCDSCVEDHVLTATGCLECGQCGATFYKLSRTWVIPMTGVVVQWVKAFGSNPSGRQDFVRRKLEWLQELVATLSRAVRFLPLRRLMTVEQTRLIGGLDGTLIHLAEVADLQLTTSRRWTKIGYSKWLADDTATLESSLADVVQEARVWVSELVHMTYSNKSYEEPLLPSVASWDGVKRRARGELEAARRLRTFVLKNLWKHRRVGTALKRHLGFTRDVLRKRGVVARRNARNEDALRRVRAKRAEVLDLMKSISWALDATRLRDTVSSLNAEHNILGQLRLSLVHSNYTRLADWSRASLGRLTDELAASVRPRVDAVVSVADLASRTLEPALTAAKERLRPVSNLPTIATSVVEIYRTAQGISTLDVRVRQMLLDEEEVDMGSGSSIVAETYWDGLSDIPAVARTQLGCLETKEAALGVATRIAGTNLQHAKRLDALRALEAATEATRVGLEGLGRLAPRNGSVALHFDDPVTIEFDRATCKRRFGETVLATRRNMRAVLEAHWAVSNATVVMDELLTRVELISRIQTSDLDSRMERLKSVLERLPKGPARLRGGRQTVVLKEKPSPYAVATRLALIVAPVHSSFVVLQLGSTSGSDSHIRVTLNAGRVTATLGHGDEEVSLTHPTNLSLGHFYRVHFRWVVDEVALDVVPLEEGRGNEQLATVLFRSRRFSPAVLLVDPLASDKSSGCIDNIVLNERLVASAGCAPPPRTRKLDTLSFDGRDWLCLQTGRRLAHIQFHLRTIQRDALVLLIPLSSKIVLAVTLRDGELLLEAPADANATAASGRSCNDGRAHTVQVSVEGDAFITVILAVDGLYRNSFKTWLRRTSGVVPPPPAEVYVGGAPVALSTCLPPNLRGCIHDLSVDGRVPVGALTSTTCPPGLGSCVCAERAVELKPLGFDVRSVAVSFYSRPSSAAEAPRTLLHYATSPRSSIRVDWTQHAALVTVSFWSSDLTGVGDLLVEGDDGVARWRQLTLVTNETSCRVSVDGAAWQSLRFGLVQRRYFASQQRLFLGPPPTQDDDDDAPKKDDGPVCYRDLVLNRRSLDMAAFVVASGATACPVTL